MRKLLPIVALITLAACMPAMAQCKLGAQAASFGFWNWAPASQIKVYVITSDFKENELDFLLAPLSTWNAVSELTGSRVKFEYKGSVTAPLYCQNCLTIVRGQVFDKSNRHLTELRTYSAAQNRIMNWASIVIDPLLTSPKALTNAVAHELGHSFGLLDCYSCKPSTTVMVQFRMVNASNEMNGPSACDVAQVKAGYQALAVQLKRIVPAKPIATDEGEEPVDDDTPIIVPKPNPDLN